MYHYNCITAIKNDLALIGGKEDLKLIKALENKSVPKSSTFTSPMTCTLPLLMDDKTRKALSNITSIDAGSSSTATLVLASSSSSSSLLSSNTHLFGLKLDTREKSEDNSCNLLLSIPSFSTPSSSSCSSSSSSLHSMYNPHHVALDVDNSRCALADSITGEIALIDLTPSSSGGSPSMVAWHGSTCSNSIGSGATSVLFWKHSPSVLLASGGPALLAFQGLPFTGSGSVKAVDVRQNPSSRPIFFSVTTEVQQTFSSSFSSSSSSSSSTSILRHSPFSLVTCLSTHISDPFSIFGGTDDGSIVKWDVRKAQHAVEVVENVHMGPVTDILITPSNELVTCGNDGTVSSKYCSLYANSATLKTTTQMNSTNNSASRSPLSPLLVTSLGLNSICWLQSEEQRRIDEKGDGIIIAVGEGGLLESTFLHAKEVEEYVEEENEDFNEPIDIYGSTTAQVEWGGR